MSTQAAGGIQVEQILDDLIGRLNQTEQSKEVRAALIEARRLRNLTARWSAIPPPDEARREMLSKVMDLVAVAKGDKSLSSLASSTTLSGAHAAVRRALPSDRPDDSPTHAVAPLATAGRAITDASSAEQLQDALRRAEQRGAEQRGAEERVTEESGTEARSSEPHGPPDKEQGAEEGRRTQNRRKTPAEPPPPLSDTAPKRSLTPPGLRPLPPTRRAPPTPPVKPTRPAPPGPPPSRSAPPPPMGAAAADSDPALSSTKPAPPSGPRSSPSQLPGRADWGLPPALGGADAQGSDAVDEPELALDETPVAGIPAAMLELAAGKKPTPAPPPKRFPSAVPRPPSLVMDAAAPPDQKPVPRRLRFRLAEGVSVVRPDAAQWRPYPNTAGVKVKLLFRDPAAGRYTALVQLSPDAQLPAHRHAEVEEMFVVSGSASIGDFALQAGDYCRADPKTVHPTIVSPRGCTLLINGSEHDTPVGEADASAT